MLTTTAAIMRRYRIPDTPSVPKLIEGGREELVRLFAQLEFTSGAEIGVWRGVFAEQLCRGIRGLRLLCVDPWQAYEQYREPKKDRESMAAAYHEASERLKPYSCTFWKMPSTQAALSIPDRTLDFVFIDGNHRAPFVRADLEAWAPKVRKGGIIAGHDYVESPLMPYIEVKPVVDGFIMQHRIDPWFLVTGDKTPSYFWVQR